MASWESSPNPAEKAWSISRLGLDEEEVRGEGDEEPGES